MTTPPAAQPVYKRDGFDTQLNLARNMGQFLIACDVAYKFRLTKESSWRTFELATLELTRRLDAVIPAQPAPLLLDPDNNAEAGQLDALLAEGDDRLRSAG